MAFSEPLFIFLFLPVFLLAYGIVSRIWQNGRNAFLLLVSSIFYCIGAYNSFYVLLFSVFVNYAFGVLIDECNRTKKGSAFIGPYSTPILIMGLLCNFVVLTYFKYSAFISENLGALLSLFGFSELHVSNITLPLGISFFSFQGTSYLIDVYRGDVPATRNLITFGAYKTLFPQLIAGPIVRYADVACEMNSRFVTTPMMFEGVRRFAYGFIKKVLFADTYGTAADAIFSLDPTSLSVSAAWLGAVSYTLQIYYDFSAYSDMAIGIGKMLGFHYPENFNYPYVSLSIREFWQRWHITLSFWFRDYLYRPLGGNRHGKRRTYLNLLIVFTLCGLWHGPSWSFVAWGLWHGLFMILERRFDLNVLSTPNLLRRAYVLVVVLIGWVLFRAGTFGQAAHLIGRMLGMDAGDVIHEVGEFINPVLVLTIILGATFAAPIYATAALSKRGRLPLEFLIAGSLFVFACSKVLSGAYSPFLYFRF